ncbi:HEAT repeat domain-containing protein [Gloeocapsopsis dulcis]|uniref:Phycocyanobilin lyase n=1 Tax=Gloeocapsopsis dulcis AAB1 = 1H9 TaxID=1433147 RepID=A0A6N8FT95_9CHRO|nr:HEAT repeat domain-containing protein [Gloeocapsopsis dulcis]MUL36079.1 phycocyanobilin lyase [Gloeocapsopsis dulcis AAB1 = 1H9]WNN91450.1 HEAT repeat domain-containing protein [Gloeocapsopsis dulcis]
MTEAQAQALIRAVEQADSAPRLVAAVKDLASAEVAAGISTLIAVLGYNNPTAAAAAVQGLIQIGSLAVQPLIAQLDDYNYGARAYAIRALAAIADPRALDILLASAATDFAPSVRRAAAKGLGALRWSELATNERSTVQTKALETLELIIKDADWSIRYAAVVGLQGLATTSELQIQDKFAQILATEKDAAVRSRVQLAQSQLFRTTSD